jgi:hypothetical protein
MTIDSKYVSVFLVLLVNLASFLAVIEVNKFINAEMRASFIALTCANYLIASFCCILFVKRNALKSFTPALLAEMFAVAVLYCAHVVFNSLSLSLNRQGTVQVIKSLCAPCVMVIYVFMQRISFSFYTKISLVL